MSINSLPSVLLVKTFLYLNLQTLCSLGKSCKKFHEFIFCASGKGKEIWKDHNVRLLNKAKANSELFVLFKLDPPTVEEMISQVKFFIAMHKYRYSKKPERYYAFINQLVNIGNKSWLDHYIEKEKKFINNTHQNANPLLIACRENNKEVVKYLIENSHIEPDLFLSLLSQMILKEKLEIIELLVSSERIDVNAYLTIQNCSYTPLGLALKNQKHEIVSCLLKREDLDLAAPVSIFNYGMTINAFPLKTTPLSMACLQDDNKSLKLLLQDKRIDVNQRISNANLLIWMLIRASDEEDVNHWVEDSLLELLAHEKIDVNCTCEAGKTALMWAAELGLTRWVKRLLEFPNIDLEKKWDGKMALELADSEEIRLLIENKK